MPRDIPRLPAVVEGAPWPTLDARVAATQRHTGAPDPNAQAAVADRHRVATRRLARNERLLQTIPKGALIGLFGFALVYGLGGSVAAWWRLSGSALPPLTAVAAWMALPQHLVVTASDWRNAAPLLVVALGITFSLVVRIRLGLVLAALMCVALGLLALPHHLLAFGVCIGAGIILRFLYQIIPSHSANVAH